MKKSLLLISSLCVVFFACDRGEKKETPKEPLSEQSSSSVSESDNSSTPSQDSSSQGSNPDSSQGSSSDQKIVDAIRIIFLNDKALSTRSKNVRITISNGTVLLEGSLADSRDASDIEQKIKRVNGVSSVDNKITIRNSESGYLNRGARSSNSGN